MSRTTVHTALVLRNRSSGESNSEISLLSAEEGIIKATVFGGAKSKLRSHSAPYNSGQVWIYRDKAKDYAKLSDFDVHSWRPGLRELYDRTMAAAAIADTILSSHGGGGDWETAMQLAVSALDTIENANEELCGRLLLHFLWDWARFLGIQQDLEHCSGCDSKIDDSAIFFNKRENNILCESCTNSHGLKGESVIRLNPGCRRWLCAVENLEPAQLHRYSMDGKSFAEAKALCTAILSGAIGKRLTSWEW